MNETTPFLQSWIFDLILLFGGAFVGFFVAAICAVSGQASRDEEHREMFFKCVDEKERLEKKLSSITVNQGDPRKA